MIQGELRLADALLLDLFLDVLVEGREEFLGALDAGLGLLLLVARLFASRLPILKLHLEFVRGLFEVILALAPGLHLILVLL